jgi:hypothetical protein
LRGLARPDKSTIVGDIGLDKVRGTQYLHPVKALRGGQIQVGNAKGHVNGWISGDTAYGWLVSVEK